MGIDMLVEKLFLPTYALWIQKKDDRVLRSANHAQTHTYLCMSCSIFGPNNIELIYILSLSEGVYTNSLRRNTLPVSPGKRHLLYNSSTPITTRIQHLK